MAIQLLDEIERLIDEGASAEALKERLEIARRQMAMLLQQHDMLRTQLEFTVHDIHQRNEELRFWNEQIADIRRDIVQQVIDLNHCVHQAGANLDERIRSLFRYLDDNSIHKERGCDTKHEESQRF